MPEISFAGRALALTEGESVLDCLLRHGEDISYSCRSGVCQSCLVRTDDNVPERAQAGLKDSLRAQGYFLACSCYPSGNLAVVSGAGARVKAQISGLDLLSETVLRVRLRSEAFTYRAGQYVSLFREDGLARSYSLASLPSEGELELQVRLVPGGRMSGWLKAAALQTPVWIQGPSGNCFYLDGRRDQPLLLAGTGTGLAPLYGIARDALDQGHTGDVWLFHGSLNASGLYLADELRALDAQYPNFHYVPVVADGETPEGGRAGALDRCVLTAFPSLEGWRSFVCGDPAFVTSFRKKIFLAGVASKEIYADAFLPSAK